MNGVHDMGGVQGYGPVDPSAAEPFHADWEKRVFALTLAASRHLRSNLDRGRYQLEVLPQAEYLKGYFQRWYARLLNQGEEAGIIDGAARASIERGDRPQIGKREREPLPAAALLHVAASGRSANRESRSTPAFAPGDPIRTRNLRSRTHTRLPGYVRGRTGTIIAYRGVHVFPDSNAELRGEDPQHLYAVRFAATALWGAAASIRDSVTLDLFEPYLERRP